MTSATLTIEGGEVRAEAGSAVLEAARGAGLYVPTMCVHSSVRSHDTCWLCIVAIEGAAGFPTSCDTAVEPGMVVHLNPPEVQRLRRSILESVITDTQHPRTYPGPGGPANRGQEVGVMGSPKATDEASYLLQKWTRSVLGSGNLDQSERQCHTLPQRGVAGSACGKSGCPGTLLVVKFVLIYRPLDIILGGRTQYLQAISVFLIIEGQEVGAEAGSTILATARGELKALFLEGENPVLALFQGCLS